MFNFSLQKSGLLLNIFGNSASITHDKVFIFALTIKKILLNPSSSTERLRIYKLHFLC